MWYAVKCLEQINDKFIIVENCFPILQQSQQHIDISQNCFQTKHLVPVIKSFQLFLMCL